MPQPEKLKSKLLTPDTEGDVGMDRRNTVSLSTILRMTGV